jgi:lipopolysaccharide biosynthesis regulator YciM
MAENDRRKQCAQCAVHVLGSVLAENDEVIEVWLLAGEAFAALENYESAVYYWERAREMLTSVQQSLEMQVAEAEEEEEENFLQQQLDEVIVQIEDVSAKLEELQAEETTTDQD